MKKQKLYIDEQGEFWILKDRIAANAHDKIYLWETPYVEWGSPDLVEVMTSPKKCGFICLGAL